MKKLNLSAQMLIGLTLGVIAGLCMQGPAANQWANAILGPVGTLFMNLIKMIVVPLVFSTIVVGTCGLGDAKKFGRIGFKTIAYFLCTTAFASILGLTVGKVMQVGKGFTIATEGLEFTTPSANVVDTFLAFIPSNALQSIVNAEMVPTIVFAIFIGAGIILTGEKAQTVFRFFDGCAEIMYRITSGIMKLAPIGIFAMMTTTVANYGAEALLPMLKLVLVIYLAFAIHLALVYGSTVRFLGKISPLHFFRMASQSMMFAFTSQTSSACLPFSMEATRKLGVPSPIRSFILPLGATVNMDGTAVYQSVCIIFISAIYGIELTPAKLLIVVLAATAASIGTAGVPNGGMATFGMVLMAAGLPVEGVALISGLIGIIGMGSTLLNITGDMACAVVVAASEKVLDDRTEEATA